VSSIDGSFEDGGAVGDLRLGTLARDSFGESREVRAAARELAYRLYVDVIHSKLFERAGHRSRETRSFCNRFEVRERVFS
jgi:hypothetical protein